VGTIITKLSPTSNNFFKVSVIHNKVISSLYMNLKSTWIYICIGTIFFCSQAAGAFESTDIDCERESCVYCLPNSDEKQANTIVGSVVHSKYQRIIKLPIQSFPDNSLDQFKPIRAPPYYTEVSKK
tara:strand:+ start:2031 stop:2408 length:378 start_codon:yes stop_codon:yes gene_type:complete